MPDTEKPRGRSRKSKILEKLLKPIKESKYGLTLNALAGYFYPDQFDLTKLESSDNYIAKENMRKLIQALKKTKTEGLKIIAVKFKDPILNITEYRYVNGFWNDALIEIGENHKKKVREGLERRIKNDERSLSMTEQERKDCIEDLELEIEYEAEAE